MNWAAEKPNWPHAEFSRFIRHDPHIWHLQDMGEGPVLLLIHGAGGSLHSFADLMPRLALKYRTVAIDLPGHGFTRRGGMQRSSLPRMVEDIIALLEAEGIEPDVIIGHSAGAAVALALSEALTPRPKATIGLNGAFEEFDGVAGWLFPLLAKLLAINPFASFFFANTTSPKNVSQLIEATGSQLSPSQLGLYYRLIRDRSHVDGALAMMSQWDLRPLVKRMGDMDVPALLLAGTRDKAVAPVVSETAAGRLPSAELDVLQDLGHLMHEEAPDLIADKIEAFLQDRL